MKHQMIGRALIGLLLASIVVLNPGSSLSETNGLIQRSASIVNSASTNDPVWLADDISVQGAQDTNGLCCVLTISNVPRHVGDIPPIGLVTVHTISGNAITCWKADPSSYLKIDLLDSQGRSVARTKEGEQYTQLLALVPLSERIHKELQLYSSGKLRTDGFTMISSTFDDLPFADFGIGDLFVIEVPGDYTLKVQMRLVEQMGIAYATNPPLQYLLLPEVSAKIHIRLVKDSVPGGNQ
ncbi:MAG: hypothetical protein ABSA47_01310 [Verrucomicrobiota bacterium]|jgi:hypothetical protein